MLINGKEVNVDDLTNKINFEQNFIKKRKNNLYLSDYQIEVLNRFGINYEMYPNTESLICAIEEILNTDYDESLIELEQVSASLAELNYYNNTTK